MDRTLVNGRAQATANEKWYKKARDWMKTKCTNLLEKCDSATLTMMKAAVVVSVPIMLATGAGCGGKTGLFIDDHIPPERDAEADVETDAAPPHDAEADTETDGDADSDVDSDSDSDTDVDSDSDSDTDSDADGDSDADMESDGDVEEDADFDDEPDGDVAPPLVPIFESLIGDHLNRTLGDREDNEPGNSNTEYPMGGAHRSENANPFTDGMGGNLGPDEVYLHGVGESSSTLLPSVVLNDSDTGDMFIEGQDVWVRGDTHFDYDVEAVVSEVDFIAYTLRFTRTLDPANEHGIPVCSDAEFTDYSACVGAVGDGVDPDWATASHMLPIQFLGSEWFVLEMVPPSAEYASLTSENELVNGGRITIGRVAVRDIIEQGGPGLVYTLASGHTIEIFLDDIAPHGGRDAAEINFTDPDGMPHRNVVNAGEPREFTISGEIVRFYISRLSPDYLPDKWMDCAVLSDMLELEDGRELNQNEGDNEGLEVTLAWSNIDASIADPQPDSLVLVSVHSWDTDNISSSGEDTLEEGDYISLVTEPEEWHFTFGGLDVTDEELHPLEIEIERYVPKEISAARGPVDDTGTQVACYIANPYITVQIDDAGEFVVRDVNGGGNARDTELYVAASGGHCEGTIGDVNDGTIFIHTTRTSSNFSYRTYTSPGQVVEFDLAGGDTSWENGGVLVLANASDIDAAESSELIAETELVDARNGPFDGPLPSMVLALVEDAGPEYAGYADKVLIPVWIDGTSSTFREDVSDRGGYIARVDEFPYMFAGPVESSTSRPTLAEDGFVTERGSVVTSITDTTFVVYVAERVVFSQYYLTSVTR